MTPRKANGPAEAATSPSRGSTNPQKDKQMNGKNPSMMSGFDKARLDNVHSRAEGFATRFMASFNGAAS